MRLIDADELKKAFIDEWNYEADYAIFRQVENIIDNAPTVEIPVARWDAYCEGQKVGYEKALSERPQGEWIKKVDDVGFISHICSKCGAEIELEDPCDNKFCFNCGAPMGGKNGLSLQKNDRNS